MSEHFVVAVVDPTDVPAQDCTAAAAVLAAWRAAGVPAGARRLPAERDAGFPRGSREYVTADGRPMPNGCWWLERALGETWTPPTDAEPRSGPLVVAAASANGLPAGVDLVLAREDVPLELDTFGRPWLTQGIAGLFETVPRRPELPVSAVLIRIAVLGFKHHLRRINPTVIARLADAADTEGYRLEVETIEAATALAEGLPAGIDGIVLPGGGDMGQVEGQIRSTEIAWENDLPVLGLCLGMQSMALAALRRGGWPEAQLEEIIGPGPQRGFVRMKDGSGIEYDRKGDAALAPISGSTTSKLLGPQVRVRMHHRFRLADDAIPVVESAGLRIAAFDRLGVADAVETPERSFQIGLQGHPEISFSRGLEGLWRGFLRACATGAQAGDRAA